ncbi:hypothetical protein K1719_013302 [Acacia pycnantha]|nr:hypothetical protein K1719_013302 [Acacia pycnantha]
MSYNYPSKKLISVYLSDDGGSELTFYAILRASLFSEQWIPFCKRFNIQTRSPEAYFSHLSDGAMPQNDQQWSSMKALGTPLSVLNNLDLYIWCKEKIAQL